MHRELADVADTLRKIRNGIGREFFVGIELVDAVDIILTVRVLVKEQVLSASLRFAYAELDVIDNQIVIDSIIRKLAVDFGNLQRKAQGVLH